MQQTDKYKLNLIERDDVFSPDALNENTRKVEEVLTTYQAGETAAREKAVADLNARVITLEGKVIALGSYVGNTELYATRTIQLPFTPAAVLIQGTAYCYLVTRDQPLTHSGGGGAKIVDKGLYIYDNSNVLNATNHTYAFVAFP